LDWLTKAAVDPQSRAVMASFILFCLKLEQYNGKVAYLMVKHRLNASSKEEQDEFAKQFDLTPLIVRGGRKFNVYLSQKVNHPREGSQPYL
jgi:hypothetical protein